MTTAQDLKRIGDPVARVDGPLKVTGSADYPCDHSYPGLTYAALVRTTVATGRISGIGVSRAEAASGVLAVITHRNAPRLGAGRPGAMPPAPLQDDRVLHWGQYAAVVIAESREEAAAAAGLVTVEYEDTGNPVLDPDDPRGELVPDPWSPDSRRGDAEAGMASADVTYDETFTTAVNTHNPLGPFTTVAAWHGDTLLVHDSTQWPDNVRRTLAGMFGLPKENVRVLAPYVGGAFGAGLRVWQHVPLAALAARTVQRPVKLELTRPEMFTGVGHRPDSVQRLRIGINRDGTLVAIDHTATSPTAMEDDTGEPVTRATATAYACPNVSTRNRRKRLNIPRSAPMRAPGEAGGNFALESALDELSHTLDLDPLELRLRNYAEINPRIALPWSSCALRECYARGAERFGWSQRTPGVGSMRDGNWLVGYGMAGVSYPWWQAPCQARATISRNGTAYVRTAATDIGTGTYTVMTQLAAQFLGLDQDHVHIGLGDTDMPAAPSAGGSGLSAAVAAALQVTCRNLVRKFLDQVADDPDSPLRGATADDVTVTGSRILRTDDPSRGEAYTDILARHGLPELTADGEAHPAGPEETGMAPAGAFGAKFVEVRVDSELGVVRVARVVSAIDAGRVLNERTARSQIIGGTVGGIGMALFEHTLSDAGTGRIANGTFGDYLVPVNADVPDMEVLFVGRPDRFNPVGVKGVGEIGLVGIAAAIANAVHHATGRRFRSLPITVDKLL